MIMTCTLSIISFWPGIAAPQVQQSRRQITPRRDVPAEGYVNPGPLDNHTSNIDNGEKVRNHVSYLPERAGGLSLWLWPSGRRAWTKRSSGCSARPYRCGRLTCPPYGFGVPP